MPSFDEYIRVTDELIEFEAIYNDIDPSRHTVSTLEIHREEIKSLWASVKSKYESYLREVAEDAADTEVKAALEHDVTVIKARQQTTYSAYVRCLSNINELSQEISARLRARAKQENPVQNTSDRGVHLPPCDMDDFDGNYASWPSFRDLFTAIYIQNPRLSQVEKLFHLNQKTKGEAKDIVKAAPLTNEGFLVAWNNLKERFENKRILVNSQLRVLFNLDIVHQESGSAIKKLQSSINGCLSALQLHEVDVGSWDPVIVYLCSKHLPKATLALWEQSLQSKDTLPTWRQLDSFLTSRFKTLETLSDIQCSSSPAASSKQSDASKEGNRYRNFRSYSTRASTVPPCQLCPKEQHFIRSCPQFLKMNSDNRLACIRKYGLCINCFARSHGVKDCQSKHNCFTCQKRHNTLLHREVSSQKEYVSPNKPSTSAVAKQKTHLVQMSTSSEKEVATVQTCFAIGAKNVLLGTAMIRLHNGSSVYYARALIDPGSEGTFISEKVRQRLRLPARPVHADISGVGARVTTKAMKVCNISISSILDANIELKATALVLPKITGDLPTSSIDSTLLSELPSIPLADKNFGIRSPIEVLIGADLLPSVLLNGIKRNICGSLVAQETIFGWILTGPVSNKGILSVAAHFCTREEIALEKSITRFWEVEDLPQKRMETESDRFCEEIFQRTTERTAEGRYVVSLPFKETFPKEIRLGSSRKIALAQFLRNEARLNKNPKFKDEYDGVLREYLELGHMEKVNVGSSVSAGANFYLPHHAVIKAESTTTKVRVVFNASSPSDNCVSLNDALYTGPALQGDLTLLILKWRFYRYVFNADIQKMYRQILVKPDQTSYQRILFRPAQGEEVTDYELKTVTFGVNCAPYLAIRTLFQLADDVKTSLPLASTILRENMYVDDVLADGHTIPSAVSARKELTQALDSAGFPLRKWSSNSIEVLRDITKDHLLSEEFLSLDEASVAKTLGIRWNAKTDRFYFHTKPLLQKGDYTKREILSEIAKLFDPAGWLSPIIVCAKILMQEIWLERVDWDAFVPPQCLKRWRDFMENFPGINDIQIPRWIEYRPEGDIEFHGFCDASEKAYAAAIYVRVQCGDRISTHLLTAESRVAPVKTLSLPRLELCGAVLLAELVQALSSYMPFAPNKLFLWTDSTIVLAWLQKPPCHWKSFIANRVSKIIQGVGSATWLHVESNSNPADLASRGVTAQELQSNRLWWHGPVWLPLPLAHWRSRTSFSGFETDLEKKPIRVHVALDMTTEDLLDRFSCFARAVRVLAYVLRFVKRTHSSQRCSFQATSLALSSCELSEVQRRLVQMAQRSAYAAEYSALQNKKLISSSSSLLSLNPFIDAEQILRVNGRLVASPSMSYNERYPIILPYNCQLSRLLVCFHHQISLHGGNQLVLRLIRTQFWIPKVKNLIKTTIHNCKTCVIHRNKVRAQIMGALPPERTVLDRPFLHTGIDFAGPFDIKSATARSRIITKGYVCVFVCFATKAIHLEATSDLSTAAFLAAFTRFVARRSCPSHLYSDNGKNFVGAARKLFSDFLSVTRDSLVAQYLHRRIVWRFIPPGAPHMGGLWEAGVRSFKIHFVKVVGPCKLTFEEFTTALARIESCLNSRPISPMSEDPTDVAALTPGHFLTGAPLLAPPEPSIQESSISIINRWQRLKALQQEFCSRWKNEYLKELHKRNKWKQPKEDLKVDSLVVIREDNLPSNAWRLGRVVKIHTGKDGRVRVADIRTEQGTVTRPVVKLVSLPPQ